MIVLKDIDKSFDEKHVLNKISFHIAPNESVGIIGKNGAGKTTLLNMMTGIIVPDSGFIRVNYTENILESYQVLRNISYVSGIKSQLWNDLKVSASLENCAKMYKVSNYAERIRELEDTFEIKDLLNSYPGSLSLGERMRCEIAYALLPEPKVLLMDESMIGLDVSVKYKIMNYFEKMKKEKNTTLIYTSHNILEVGKLCDRIILIDEGRKVYDGSIERIMREYAPLYELTVITAENKIPEFEDIPIDSYLIEQEKINIYFDKKKIATAELIKYIISKCKVNDLKLHEPNLEDTIKQIYRHAENKEERKSLEVDK